jgi:hypothetical protein
VTAAPRYEHVGLLGEGTLNSCIIRGIIAMTNELKLFFKQKNRAFFYSNE